MTAEKGVQRMFTDRDLELLEKSLSGKAISFEISRRDLKGLLARLKSAEAIFDYASHASDCILSFWTAGKQKCNCFLNVAWNRWVKITGKHE